MAWRALGKKGYSASLTKASTLASLSECGAQDFAKILSASVRHLHGHCQPTNPNGVNKGVTFVPNMWLIRHLHVSRALLSRRKEDDSLRLKNSKRVKVVNGGKFSRRKKENNPPVETPYVPPKLKKATKSLPDKTIEIFEGITVGELAKRCGEFVQTVQNIIVNVGDKADSEFDGLSIDIAELVAMEVGVSVRRLHSDEGVKILPRPPVVTVMGHVDHGKTSLLDALRQTSLAAREAGGITQHLGAFVVGMQSGAAITFLDTPGHAAFSAMRARGAAITDVVVLVVAADDGVMPQTLEAIAHARDAGVPVVVAINKCDKQDADPERVKVQLASEGLMLEEMGGDVQVVNVSAVNRSGLDQLEEALLLQAELMDLKARIDGPAQAYVVEARVDKGRGPLATAIIKAGTLVCGQDIVVGSEWGRIRCIRDMSRKTLAQATPSMPVEIEGLKGLPMAGDDIVVVVSEERARMLSEGRKKKERRKQEEENQERWKLEGEEHRRRRLEMKLKEHDEKTGLKMENVDGTESKDFERECEAVEIPIIVKGDVQGTVQAVGDSLRSLNSPQVVVKVIHAGVGPVSQSDVDMAKACCACIVGFNVRDLPSAVSHSACQAKIKIVLHRVIYHLLEDIGNLMVELAPGTLETKVDGEAHVLNIFEVKGKKGKGEDMKIAGCRVVDGRVSKSATLRLVRSGETVFEGCCASLKREQHDVDAVGKGNDCGLVIKGWADFRVGDVVQCLVKIKRKPKFVSSESGAVRIEC